jgi:hypothetical protein
MRKPKGLMLLKSADIALIEGRAIVILAAEDAGAATMISEAVVCLPHETAPLAHRCRTDYSALSQHRSKFVPSIEQEHRRMWLLAGGMLRRHIRDKEPQVFERFVTSGHHLLVELSDGEFTEITLAERSAYPFQTVFEQTQCRCLREYLGELLDLPPLVRTISPF